MTTARLYELFLRYPSVETDTRKLKKGDLFFALSGPNFNGNNFALDALAAGASYAIVDEEMAIENEQVIKVDNVLAALQLLAKHHREQFSIPFIAITGSNGKTTTKELVNVVLASHYTTSTTQGNLNNHIGIPLTLLRVPVVTEIAVIEMGANHQKEIEGYCEYTKPTHGIITNCGKAHLEGFGGEEGVRKGKGELFDYLRTHRGTAFIFKDYDYLEEMSEGINEITTYGTKDATTMGRAMPSETFLKVELGSETSPININTRLVGNYNLPNVLCAVAIGKTFQVPMEKIVHAIESYEPGNSRSQMLVKGSNHVILDAYNANPSSMKLAIENIANITCDSKVLVLGAMMELGWESLEEHKNVIDIINLYKWKSVILVGGDFNKVAHTYHYFDTSLKAADWVKTQHFNHSFILIKGSRSTEMEKAAEVL